MKFVTRSVAKTISILYRMVPEAGYYIFPDFLDHFGDRRILEQIFLKFRMQSICVKGAQGVFYGAAKDLDVIGRYAVQGFWSSTFLDIVLRYLEKHPDFTYIDIGANIGLTSVPIAAAGFKVTAFEPVSANFEYLNINAAANGATANIKTVNAALIDRIGFVDFELSPSNFGDHRCRFDQQISGMDEDSWEVVQVATTTLDDAMKDATANFIVKMDTQGSEPLVVLGGKATLERAKMILCEFSPYQMYRMGTDHRIIVDLLGGFDSLDVYTAEEEEPCLSLNGSAAVPYLMNYYESHKENPWGKYLNLVGVRN